jgi:hypothetical protein
VERYIPADQPVLVVVLDGMSYAVCRELAADPAIRRWSPWSADGHEIPPAVTALPSVTEFSRFSLISGSLARGTQGAEEIAFSARPSLAKQHPPVLFHKNDLAAMADPESPVLREIADTRRSIVGIVINAIDDSLSGPVQIAPDWNLEYLAVLRPLLAEASAAGRIVLLTSDHGHVLDYGTEFRRHDSDRYHSGKPEVPGEFYLEGGRVIGSAGLTALGVEGVKMIDERYMRVKEVAAKIGMSEDWVRRAFGEVEGVRKIKSPAKRFKRPYTILLIPTAMVERELRKMSA